jgi:hypothetical protein
MALQPALDQPPARRQFALFAGAIALGCMAWQD